MALKIDATLDQKIEKIDLYFQKWHEEFSKCSPEHWKAKKLALWWDPFIQSRKCMSLKLTGKFCLITMKNDAKFEEDLTGQFIIDIRNLTKFGPSTRKSQKFAISWASFEQSI